MSVHYEWFDLPRVEFVPVGTEVGEHEVSESDGGALLLWNDECAVVTGTPKELLDWALNLVEVVAANQRPRLAQAE